MSPKMTQMPTEREVRKALARLVARGIDSVWLPDVQPLFRLPAVQEKVAELGEDDAGDALRAVLEAAVERMGQSQYRSLLIIVLGLKPEYAQLAAGERRRIAGLEFRGGVQPVSPGTIRQHHEPKALDELAAVLVSAGDRALPPPGLSADLFGTGGGRGPLEWHPLLHESWAEESLVFYRLSLGAYRRETALEGIKRAMQRADVRSWAVFEVFGAFDILIRAWIPAGSRGATGELLEMQDGVELLDAFFVDQVVSSWIWKEANGRLLVPPPRLLSQPLPSAAINRLNEGDEQDFEPYEELGVVARPPLLNDCIGFFIALGVEGNALVLSDARRLLETQIVEVVGGASQEGFSNLSIYAGAGFSNFLIQGCVPAEHFHDLHRSLLAPLSEATPVASRRVNTFVASSPVPLLQEEAMRGGKPPSGEEASLSEQLEQGEGESLEILGAAFTELYGLRNLGPEAQPPQTRAAAARLARVVTAFLNTEGGSVIVGACDKDAIERDRTLSEHRIFAEAAPVGDYLVTGIDHELKKGVDEFARRLQSSWASSIEPDPMSFLRVEFRPVEGRTVCVIHVLGDEASNARKWFYCKSKEGQMKFFVRHGATTISLAGPRADDYKTVKARW